MKGGPFQKLGSGGNTRGAARTGAEIYAEIETRG